MDATKEVAVPARIRLPARTVELIETLLEERGESMSIQDWANLRLPDLVQLGRRTVVQAIALHEAKREIEEVRREMEETRRDTNRALADFGDAYARMAKIFGDFAERSEKNHGEDLSHILECVQSVEFLLVEARQERLRKEDAETLAAIEGGN